MNKQLFNESDSIAKDLKVILTDNMRAMVLSECVGDHKTAKKEEDIIMQKLVSYIVRYGHKVYNHAYHLGEENEKNQNQINTKKK